MEPLGMPTFQGFNTNLKDALENSHFEPNNGGLFGSDDFPF